MDRAEEEAEAAEAAEAAEVAARAKRARLESGWVATDLRLWEGAYAAGWRVIESHGRCTYFSPAGEEHGTLAAALEFRRASAAGEQQGAAFGWQRGYSQEGEPYYYHAASQATQWEAPAGWREDLAEAGERARAHQASLSEEVEPEL